MAILEALPHGLSLTWSKQTVNVAAPAAAKTNDDVPFVTVH